MLREITVRTRRRSELIDITGQVRKIVSESGVTDGLCHLFVPHTTAGVTTNEKADPHVARDIETTLGKIIPAGWDYKHTEGNSDAHIKSSIIGVHEVLIITDGRPVLGTWQAVFFCEFDGPRSRRCLICVKSD